MQYSEQLLDHFKNPRNQGKLTEPDAIGEVGNMKCGDIMRVYLKIDNDIIEDIKFETLGCAAAIASSSVLTELAKGKSLVDAEKISKQDIADALGGMPAIKFHCSVLGEEALQKAIENYKLNHNKE